MITSAQVVETSVTVTSNSPSQDNTQPDDHILPNYDRTILLSRVRSAMECTGENFFRVQGGKTAPLKFGLFDQIFSFLPKVVALVLTVIFSKKTKTIPRANRTNHRTAASFNIFCCSPRKLGCTCLCQFGHIFSEV